MSIACLVAGSYFTTHDNIQSRRNIVVDEAGDVYVWGNMKNKGSPKHERSRYNDFAVKLTNLPKIIMVSCGNHTSALVDQDGRLWTWGGNFGSGHRLITHVPTLVPQQIFNAPIVMVACGASHTLALSATGHVFTCGSGHHGELGHDNRRDIDTFSSVTTLSNMGPGKCIMVAAGEKHSVVLHDSGMVLTFGQGQMGALGLLNYSDALLPRRVVALCDAEQHVEMVAAGGAHTAVVTSAGVLWTWGSGVFGQLGVPRVFDTDTSTDTTTVTPMNKCVPQRVRMPQCPGTALTNRVMSVSCGAFHTLILKQNGSLWGCGQNTNDELSPLDSITGHPPPQDYVFTPRLIDPTHDGRKFASIFATFRGSSAVDEFGELLQWGSGMTGGGPDVHPCEGLVRLGAFPKRIGRCHEPPHAMTEALCMGAMERLAIRDEPPHCAMRNGFDNPDAFHAIMPLCISWPEGEAGDRLRSMPGLMRWIGAYLVRQSRF
jgi:alpha-tubulin suppressor-like RCC1 family protein